MSEPLSLALCITRGRLISSAGVAEEGALLWTALAWHRQPSYLHQHSSLKRTQGALPASSAARVSCSVFVLPASHQSMGGHCPGATSWVQDLSHREVQNKQFTRIFTFLTQTDHYHLCYVIHFKGQNVSPTECFFKLTTFAALGSCISATEKATDLQLPAWSGRDPPSWQVLVKVGASLFYLQGICSISTFWH